MRALALAAALLSTGCVVHHRYGALAPEHGVPGQPFTAQAEAEGVRVVARAGDWQGWPENVEDRLTPVAVTVENRSGKALRLRPESYELLDPGGFRHRVLTAPELQREFAWLATWGSYGWYGWYGPWPYSWWGWPPYGPYYPGPWGGVVWYGQPSPPPGRVEGTLQDGGRFGGWIFFPVPTAALPRFDLLLHLVDDASGKPFGEVRLSFLREGERWPPPGVPPPPPGAPPPPPGKASPPPPEKAPAPEKAPPAKG